MVVVSVRVLSASSLNKPFVSTSGAGVFFVELQADSNASATNGTHIIFFDIIVLLIRLMYFIGVNIVQIIIGSYNFILAHSLLQALEDDEERWDN